MEGSGEERIKEWREEDKERGGAAGENKEKEGWRSNEDNVEEGWRAIMRSGGVK